MIERIAYWLFKMLSSNSKATEFDKITVWQSGFNCTQYYTAFHLYDFPMEYLINYPTYH